MAFYVLTDDENAAEELGWLGTAVQLQNGRYFVIPESDAEHLAFLISSVFPGVSFEFGCGDATAEFIPKLELSYLTNVTA